MLAFIAIIFILAVTLLIGWRVGRSVPDEVELGGEYLHLGLDVLFLLLASMTLYGFGYLLAALLAVAFIAVRKLFPYLYAPASGVILALATFLTDEVQIIIFALALLLNFLLGVVTPKQETLIKRTAWQPAVALTLFAILQFFP